VDREIKKNLAQVNASRCFEIEQKRFSLVRVTSESSVGRVLRESRLAARATTNNARPTIEMVTTKARV